ncbi:MAG: hypothetical protein FGM54_11035 [Chitinophagaceae bacterium]|nr:hypothetical protein [Chitinophagaceae bacterium]
MQVTSIKFIGDSESVRLGTEKLLKDLVILKEQYLNETKLDDDEEYLEVSYQRMLIEKFNPELTYSYEVLELANEINMKYFSGAPSNLFKNI